MILRFDPGRVFFTADSHFNHANIIDYCNRPFDNVEQMDEVLINNWNRVVGSDDVVFYLGDFCLGGSMVWTKILDRLNGRIYLILGNHDLRNLRRNVACRFESVALQMMVELEEQKILLNHYPFLCYDGADDGVWQLFGHVHSGSSSIGSDLFRLDMLYPSQYDLGVDNNAYSPVSFIQVKHIITKQIQMSKQKCDCFE